ncbi:hypothetical protein DEJ46_38430 [Streptomyces venezuelae]|uniref:Uncharacterized protein n=1 Tax=Streptomyces venezuelae TaxID=54571 RepID=A0A5P2B2R5_STRVZ|nr:hypothetical protein DEJ46_38430 [Streptomyces venezuelae]
MHDGLRDEEVEPGDGGGDDGLDEEGSGVPGRGRESAAWGDRATRKPGWKTSSTGGLRRPVPRVPSRSMLWPGGRSRGATRSGSRPRRSSASVSSRTRGSATPSMGPTASLRAAVRPAGVGRVQRRATVRRRR